MVQDTSHFWTIGTHTIREENARRRGKKERYHLQEGLKQVKRCSYTADGDRRRHPIYFCPGMRRTRQDGLDDNVREL
ncbi:hypothetical protein PFLUV_G00111440 [Perca fluviatilis]|uniref:Uncharacterized protein n=1 Tax=Perca fluviatilis TaxID=8168 RepID=A0A6A5E9Z0_PERFL|nr:hypothetical protein PFLUV_G00111440 [Perca fluviatilis]